MQQEIPSLCQGFNAVSIKKGELFKIELVEGGQTGMSYDVDVVSGKAVFQGTDERRNGAFVDRTFYFRAEEAGDVEVVAQATMQGYDGRKAPPLSFRLKVQ
jgi:hypothetical protein